MHFLNAILQITPVQMLEAFFKPFHFTAPFIFGYQGPGADNENGTDVAPGLQLPKNQARFI
jgi:hypothetical protein